MFKHFILIVTIICAAWAFYATTASAQPKDEGIRLLKEADALQQNARSVEDLRRAGEKYEQALLIFEKAKDTRLTGAVLNNLGLLYARSGHYRKAAENYARAIEIARQVGNQRGEGGSLQNLGLVYNSWGHYPKAIEHFNKALELLRKEDKQKEEQIVLQSLGNTYVNMGLYEKALQAYEQSLAIAIRIGHRVGEFGVLNNIAAIHEARGQYIKALEYLEKSLELSRQIDHAQSGMSQLANLGNVYGALGQRNRSLECYEKSLEVARKVGDAAQENRMLHNIGVAHAALGQYEKALSYLTMGLDTVRKMGGRVQGYKTLFGNTYLDMGDIQAAEPFVKEAKSYVLSGRYHLLRQEFTKARENYEKLCNWAEKSRGATQLFQGYTGLGLVFEGLGENPKAAEYFRKAVTQTEDMRSGLSLAEKAEFYNVRLGGFLRTAPYEGLARVMIKMKRPREAFRESEYTRARVFTEAVSKRSEYAGEDVPRDIRDKDNSLIDQVSTLTRNLQQAYEKGNEEVISVLEPQVKEAKESLAAHIDALRKQYPLYAATRYPEPMDLERTSLGADEWVLAYDVTDPGVIVYLCKGKKLIKALFKPIPRKELDELVRKFREPLELKPGESLPKKLAAFDLVSGNRLSDILVSDMLADLPKGTPVIVVPDDSLGVLPFEMLVLNTGGSVVTDKKVPYTRDAEFFGDRNPISYYQSVTALTLSRTLQKGKKGGGRMLVMADPVFQMRDARLQKEKVQEIKIADVQQRLYQKLMAAMEEGQTGGLNLPRLPRTEELARELSGTYSGQCDVYTGIQASKDTFFKKITPSLDKYDKIVFATHGYFGKDIPGLNEPVLMLSLVPPGTDGYLRLSEIMGLRMHADAVALTACQSGLGQRISGEGTMGMGRAFQYAGARSVLMSLWSVAELTSVKLVESFFKHAKEGKSKLEALNLARKEIRQSGYDHPFFWAAFILVGEAK